MRGEFDGIITRWALDAGLAYEVQPSLIRYPRHGGQAGLDHVLQPTVRHNCQRVALTTQDTLCPSQLLAPHAFGNSRIDLSAGLTAPRLLRHYEAGVAVLTVEQLRRVDVSVERRPEGGECPFQCSLHLGARDTSDCPTSLTQHSRQIHFGATGLLTCGALSEGVSVGVALWAVPVPDGGWDSEL
jgi:hypothetical protein